MDTIIEIAKWFLIASGVVAWLILLDVVFYPKNKNPYRGF